jgi:predicted transcriptional regulator
MQLRLKPAVGELLEELASKMQITKTGVITTALIELAERKGVKLKEGEEDA